MIWGYHYFWKHPYRTHKFVEHLLPPFECTPAMERFDSSRPFFALKTQTHYESIWWLNCPNSPPTKKNVQSGNLLQMKIKKSSNSRHIYMDMWHIENHHLAFDFPCDQTTSPLPLSGFSHTEPRDGPETFSDLSVLRDLRRAVWCFWGKSDPKHLLPEMVLEKLGTFQENDLTYPIKREKPKNHRLKSVGLNGVICDRFPRRVYYKKPMGNFQSEHLIIHLLQLQSITIVWCFAAIPIEPGFRFRLVWFSLLWWFLRKQRNKNETAMCWIKLLGCPVGS